MSKWRASLVDVVILLVIAVLFFLAGWFAHGHIVQRVDFYINDKPALSIPTVH